MKWRDVPENVSKSYTYYGLGGWLLFFYVLTVIGIVLNGLVVAYFILTGENVLPAEAGSIYLVSAYVITLIPFLIMAPTFDTKMPITVIGMSLLYYLLTIIDHYYANDWQRDGWSFALVPLPYMLLFIWYILSSKRVNATYRGRVPEEFAELAEDGIAYNGAIILQKVETYWFRDTAFTSLESAQKQVDKVFKS